MEEMALNKRQKELLELLRSEIKPATGCTEPIAVAYAVATAKEQVNGELKSLEIQVDPNIYKNGLMVTIPGTKEKGLVAGAALGFVAGDPKKELRVIDNVKKEDLKKAKLLIEQKKVNLSLKKDCHGLYIEVILIANESKVRIIIKDSHLNIVNIEKINKGEEFKPFLAENKKINSSENIIQKYRLKDFIEFSNKISVNEMDFLKEGIEMNLAIAEEGLKIENGVGVKFREMVEEGLMADNIINRAGAVYLLGGNKKQILGAMYNMVGSIAGIICDGAKEGCAYKLALASGWAVQAAILSMKGAIINKNDGILAGDFKKLFKNLGYTCNPGMVPTDEAILEIMLEKEKA